MVNDCSRNDCVITTIVAKYQKYVGHTWLSSYVYSYFGIFFSLFWYTALKYLDFYKDSLEMIKSLGDFPAVYLLSSYQDGALVSASTVNDDVMVNMTCPIEDEPNFDVYVTNDLAGMCKVLSGSGKTKIVPESVVTTKKGTNVASSVKITRGKLQISFTGLNPDRPVTPKLRIIKKLGGICIGIDQKEIDQLIKDLNLISGTIKTTGDKATVTLTIEAEELVFSFGEKHQIVGSTSISCEVVSEGKFDHISVNRSYLINMLKNAKPSDGIIVLTLNDKSLVYEETRDDMEVCVAMMSYK